MFLPRDPEANGQPWSMSEAVPSASHGSPGGGWGRRVGDLGPGLGLGQARSPLTCISRHILKGCLGKALGLTVVGTWSVSRPLCHVRSSKAGDHRPWPPVHRGKGHSHGSCAPIPDPRSPESPSASTVGREPRNRGSMTRGQGKAGDAHVCQARKQMSLLRKCVTAEIRVPCSHRLGREKGR